MRRVVLMIVFICICSFCGFSQDVNAIDAILVLTGASSPEELDDYEYEMYTTLIANPLNINVNRVNKFVTSGIFTSYQAASLMDYRLRHGDVMSFSELASIDGFNEEFVRKIRPFISLASSEIGNSQLKSKHNLHNIFNQIYKLLYIR